MIEHDLQVRQTLGEPGAERLDDVILEDAAEFPPERIARFLPIISEDEAGYAREVGALVENAAETRPAFRDRKAAVGENPVNLRIERRDERRRIGGRGKRRG